MPYSFVSVKKKSPNAGRPVGKGAYILLYKQDDIATCTRDENGVKVIDFSFLALKKPIGIYHTASTQNVFQTSTGDDDSRGHIHNVDFEVPGTDLEFDEFVENNLNEDLGAISISCDSMDCKIAGTKGNPLKFTQDNTEDSSKKRGHSIQLKTLIPGSVLGHISKGAIPLTDNLDINAILGLTGTGSEGAGL